MTVVYRNPRWARWLQYSMGAFGVLVGLEPILVTPPRGPTWAWVALGTAFALVSIRVWIVGATRQLAYLTEDSYVEQRLVRRLTIPLIEIENVTAPHPAGLVEVRLTSGKRLRLKGVPIRGKHRDRALTLIREAVATAS